MIVTRYRSHGATESEVAAFAAILFVIEAVALPLGWLNAGRTSAWPTSLAILFWIGAGLLNLVIYDLATRVACVVLKPWRPTFAIVLVAGTVFGTPLLELSKHIYIDMFQARLVGEDLWRPLPSTSIMVVVKRQALNVILWVLINEALVRYHGLHRFGYYAAKTDTTAADSKPVHTELVSEADPSIAIHSMPAFFSRIRKPIGPIWALVAEEHYLRVIGELDEELILYRISDAVKEMEGRVQGARVHRSYWVAAAGVARGYRIGSGSVLVLHNGTEIPVSRTFRAAAVKTGLLSPAVKRQD